MIGRRFSRKIVEEDVEPKAFDDFDMRLGDIMRGERATLGKSLLDVQRELRIKASYVAAIENADPTVFDTPGFISGYVRSYARYLNMDPDLAFAAFCNESGFSTAHGMSSEASSLRKSDFDPRKSAKSGKNSPAPFGGSGLGLGGLAHSGVNGGHDSILSRMQPGAIGSMLVLVGLIGAIGFGGWTVLNEVQRVQLAPIENVPNVLADLDPLQNATHNSDQSSGQNSNGGFGASNALDTVVADASMSGLTSGTGVFNPPSTTIDRLYRPQALDVPIMIARDAPISTLNPDTQGSFAQLQQDLAPLGDVAGDIATPRVLAEDAPDVVLVAALPAWIRVRSADGTIIFEKVLEKGEEYVLPATQEPPTLRAGMSGWVYFKVNGEVYGPAGNGTASVRDVALSVDDLKENYAVADLSNPELVKVFAVADASRVLPDSE